jgi:hypothetical protein
MKFRFSSAGLFTRHTREGGCPIWSAPKKWDARLRGHDWVMVLLCAVLMLSACSDSQSDIHLPHLTSTDEVPDTVANQPLKVQRVNTDWVEAQSWPRLGDVPEKPTNFSSEAMIEQGKQSLIRDRKQAESLKKQDPHFPADIPPPPGANTPVSSQPANKGP